MQETATKSIKILYFALMRDQSGVPSEVCETTTRTALELFNELSEKYNFTLTPAQLRVAVNDKISSWDETLKSDDVITFLPPVSGG